MTLYRYRQLYIYIYIHTHAHIHTHHMYTHMCADTNTIQTVGAKGNDT